jgi:hypothetical protein
MALAGGDGDVRAEFADDMAATFDHQADRESI